MWRTEAIKTAQTHCGKGIMNMRRDKLNNHKNTISRKHHDEKKLKSGSLICFCEKLNVYVHCCLPPESWKQQAKEHRWKQKVNVYPAPACFTLFLCGRVSGLWWDHSSVFLLLKGTPCSYVLITQTLHVIWGSNKGRAFIRQEQRVDPTGITQCFEPNSILKWTKHFLNLFIFA